MKNLHQFFYGGILLLVINSCSKDNGEAVQKKRAEEFKNLVTDKKFKLIDFYSDKPIDYIENDQIIKAETDLRPYIKIYLNDDENLFSSDGSLKIYQNNIKYAGNDTSVLSRNFSVRWNATEASMNFVDYFYFPQWYKLSEFSADYFTIYLDWHIGGAKIYSRFVRITP